MFVGSAAQPASDSTAAQPDSVCQATLASAAQPAAVTNRGSTIASISGVLHIDECSQLQAELTQAAVLLHNYSGSRDGYGRIGIHWYSADHLQLPPAPESSSMLLSLCSSAAQPASDSTAAQPSSDSNTAAQTDSECKNALLQ